MTDKFSHSSPSSYKNFGSWHSLLLTCALGVASLLSACGGGSNNDINVNVSADATATGKLNDTGIDWCNDNFNHPNGGLLDPNPSPTARISDECSRIQWGVNLWGRQQDGYLGRDAQKLAGTLPKVGAGFSGFDYTKLGASGKILSKQDGDWSNTGTEAEGTQWDCVRDNVTGLVWEVKRNDVDHLRHSGHRYSWYSPSTDTNGGSAGYESPQLNGDNTAVTGPTCIGVYESKCNTLSYVTAVNAVGLCGKKDWRIPTIDELVSLTNTGNSALTIDTNYFPNTLDTYYWSSSPVSNNPDASFITKFNKGESIDEPKNYANHVRLVRSAQ